MTTKVYFLLEAEEETPITDIEYLGYPHFEIGDTISIQVNNNNPDIWDVTPIVYTEYKIVRKKHDALKYYGNSVNYSVRLFIYLNHISE